MAIRGLVSYWVLPIISGVVWLATLLALLLEWLVNDNGRRYPTMSENHDIAYISNVGAERLQPLFIVGCVLTSVFLDLSFAAERWLRHRGRLVPNTSRGEKVLAVLTIVFAVVGTVGLICLAIFETGTYKMLHNTFLALFIGGYMFSAVFICWEYQRLGIKYREHRLLRVSFWVKLGFVLLELALLILFAVFSRLKRQNVAAIFEWIVALVFSFYVFSFVIDLYPAVRTRSPESRYPKPSAVPSAMSASVSSSTTPVEELVPEMHEMRGNNDKRDGAMV